MDSDLLYVGTYTDEGSTAGIHLMRLERHSGKLEYVGVVNSGANPSFLAIHPNGRVLYAVNELGTYNGRKSGAVSAFEIAGDTGALTRRNEQPSEGGAPCFVSTDRGGKVVLVANYSGGNVALLPIKEDGTLSPATDVEQHTRSGPSPAGREAAHAHCIIADPSNRFVLAADPRCRWSSSQMSSIQRSPHFVSTPSAASFLRLIPARLFQQGGPAGISQATSTSHLRGARCMYRTAVTTVSPCRGVNRCARARAGDRHWRRLAAQFQPASNIAVATRSESALQLNRRVRAGSGKWALDADARTVGGGAPGLCAVSVQCNLVGKRKVMALPSNRRLLPFFRNEAHQNCAVLHAAVRCCHLHGWPQRSNS